MSNKDIRKSFLRLGEIIGELQKSDNVLKARKIPKLSISEVKKPKWGPNPVREKQDRGPHPSFANPPKMQKSDMDGHATIKNIARSTKPMQAAKPAVMPMAKSDPHAGHIERQTRKFYGWDKGSSLPEGDKLLRTGSGQVARGDTVGAHKTMTDFATGWTNNPKKDAKDIVGQMGKFSQTYKPKTPKLPSLQKANIPAAKHTQPIKHIANPAKEKAYMKVQKSIVLIQKQMDPSTFRAMTDDQIIKSFGSIPGIMKDVDARPHSAWWDRCIERSQNFSEQPANYVGRIWYGDIVKGAPWAEEEYESVKEEPVEDAKEEEEGDDTLKKWISNALEGGGLASLKNHPRAGNAIRNCATYVGKSILGRSDKILKDVGNLDPAEVGAAVIDALDEIVNATGDDKLQKAWSGALGGLISKGLGGILGAAGGAGIGAVTGGPVGAALGGVGGGAAGSAIEDAAAKKSKIEKKIDRGAALQAAGTGLAAGYKRYGELTQKAVAEPIGSKYSPQPRKSKLGKEYDGESAVSGDGTKLNTEDLADKSQTTKDY